MFWLLPKYRRAVVAEADEYVESFGDSAYRAARNDARSARLNGQRRREKFLRRVCKEIAKRMDYVPGVDTATRYVEDQEPYIIDGPPLVRKRPDDTTLH